MKTDLTMHYKIKVSSVSLLKHVINSAPDEHMHHVKTS